MGNPKHVFEVFPQNDTTDQLRKVQTTYVGPHITSNQNNHKEPRNCLCK